MRVVIAPDSFKGSLGSPEVAAALARGWQLGDPDAEVVRLPMADGGEGTLDALVGSLGGEVVTLTVEDPLGRPVEAGYGLIPAAPGRPRTAVVEMAAASGLDHVDPCPESAVAASTYGTGQLIAAALDAGVGRLVLTLGGSATTDGGAGMAEALGVRLLDADGQPIPRGGAALGSLAALDLSGLHPGIAACEVVAGCDVDNPLHGPRGAAAIFGPQKGADAATIEVLDAGLRRLGEVCSSAGLAPAEERPGAGAAGGLGYAAMVFLGAELASGFDLVADAVGLDEQVAGADLVITGEGRLDAQSLAGKTPIGVLRRAQRHGVPVIAVAGDVTEGAAPALEAGMAAAFTIVPGPVSLADAVADAEAHLERIGRHVAGVWRAARG